jgi:peptide/nickel transport system substrate-binding protein
MSDREQMRRRRFLRATGAAALTGSLAGCGGSNEPSTTTAEAGTGSGTEASASTATSAEGSFDGLDAYPYSSGTTDVQRARQVMEEAGYGPDNRYELSWLQYQSPTWQEMANTIRSRLQSAYVDMEISSADFGSLLERTETGDMQAYTLGWIADYPAPQNFLQLVDPPNTIYDAEGTTPNGARLFWSEDAEGDPDVRQFMIDQFATFRNNPESTDEARQRRAAATRRMEEGLWESAALLPVYHQVSDVFWYDRVDYDPPGGMGGSRAKANVSVTGLDGDTLRGSTATFNSLDPIASGNTASGGKIMDMFDAPLNYRNGTTTVENLLVEEYTVSDDLTTYEFTLKEGVQFHGDYGELTADDVVYSIRRLVESENSTNAYFSNSVLNIERETNDDGSVVPGSTGVEKTGEYSFTVELREPFGYALSVLSYSAFSVVPEGIVGDIEGYDGEMSYEEFSTSNPVGAGPFEFETWEPGNGGEFAATAFSEYHGGEPAFDLQSAIITDPTAAYNYFLNENADIAGIPTSKYDPNKVTLTEEDGSQQLGTYGPIGDGKTVNMARTPTINTFYVGFHMERVPKAVRQAMAYVINREQFVENIFKERGAGAYHLTPPEVFPDGADAYREHWQG